MSAKEQCQLCGFKAHILIPHLLRKHPKVEPVVYAEKHGPLYSEYGGQHLRESMVERKATPIAREREDKQLLDMFPELETAAYSYKDNSYPVFATPGPLTPKLNERYLFPEQQTLDLLCLLEKTQRNSVYIQGWSGTGKSELARNILAKINAEMVRVNGDVYLTRRELIGRWRVKGGETIFEYGPVPLALMHGYTLVIDEYDTMNPICVNVLKPIFEDDAQITIMETGWEVIHAHPDFRVIVTANTWARGDDSGMFGNTQTQSIADQRRFNGFIELNYLPKEVEMQILANHFPQLAEAAAVHFIAVANKIRDAFKAGKIFRTFSPAELVNWVENYEMFARSVHHAARLSFLTAYDGNAQTAVLELINAEFGHEDAV